MTDKICIVLLCNQRFFDKMIETLKGIIYTGYIGDICLVIGDDLKNSELLKTDFLIQCGVTIKYFPDIKFSEKFDQNKKPTELDRKSTRLNSSHRT